MLEMVRASSQCRDEGVKACNRANEAWITACESKNASRNPSIDRAECKACKACARKYLLNRPKSGPRRQNVSSTQALRGRAPANIYHQPPSNMARHASDVEGYAKRDGEQVEPSDEQRGAPMASDSPDNRDTETAGRYRPPIAGSETGDMNNRGEADFSNQGDPRTAVSPTVDIIATALGGATDAWETRAQHCGALMLAHHVRNMSGWHLRVYHDDAQKAADMNILGALQALGVELVHVEAQAEAAGQCNSRKDASHTKHFWPLRALSDVTVRTSIILDAGAPFSVHKLANLAEQLTQEDERWTFWRNPDEAFADVPDNSHAPQMHFIGARHPDVGIVERLEADFCDTAKQKEVHDHGWNHDSVMDFPIRTLIPLFKLDADPDKYRNPSMPDMLRAAEMCVGEGVKACTHVNSRVILACQDAKKRKGKAISPDSMAWCKACHRCVRDILKAEYSKGVPGNEILGQKPGLHHTEPGSSLHFEWNTTKGETRHSVVPFFKVQAWPRIDCKYARDREECRGLETHPDIHSFSSIALDRVDKNWHQFCTADVSSSLELLQADAKRGSIYTTLVLAHKLRQSGQVDEANEWLKKMGVVDRLGKQVESGDAQAAYNLGVLHHHGRGVEKNATLAYLLYQRARDGNVSAAVFNMGLMREQGEGVEQNHGEAFRLYHSIATDHSGAAYQLAGLWIRGEGVDQNHGEAISLYKWAALRHQNADAQFALGELHREGKHVEQDDARAVDMYSRAAKQEHAVAMRSIGLMYWEGRGGLKEDRKMAQFMFYKAEHAGDVASKEIRDRLKIEEDKERAESDKTEGVKPSEEPFDLSQMKFKPGGSGRAGEAPRAPQYFGDR